MSGIRPIRKQDYSCQHWHNWRWDGWCLSWPPRPCQAQSHRAAGQCELTPGQLPASLCRSSWDNGWAGNCDKHLIMLIYSGGKKYVVFCFPQLLPQILVEFQNQGQIWNLMVLMFSKQISQLKLGQIAHVGGVLKTSGPADFKLTKICRSNRPKQNIKLFLPVLYF